MHAFQTHSLTTLNTLPVYTSAWECINETFYYSYTNGNCTLKLPDVRQIGRNDREQHEQMSTQAKTGHAQMNRR